MVAVALPTVAELPTAAQLDMQLYRGFLLLTITVAATLVSTFLIGCPAPHQPLKKARMQTMPQIIQPSDSTT